MITKHYQVYVNGEEYVQLTYTSSNQVIGGYQVTFENCGAVFNSVDFENDEVLIMSLGEDYLLDSETIAVFE